MQLRRLKISILVLFLIIVIGKLNMVSAETDAQYIYINNIRIANVFKKTISQDLEGNVLIADEKSYQIVYMPSYDHEFLIDIQQGPFDSVRTEAEQKLLALLEISEKDACWLYVVITASKEVDNEKGGKNYSPSFCEGVDTSKTRPPQCTNSPDLNNDGVVNALDHARAIANFGKKSSNYDPTVPAFQRYDASIREDVNCDGIVDALDLSIIVQQLGN